jgi:NADH:ubiquinone oxidoreductase subunit 5 (subunit L)/multisubunit Na+/H+ antiporter MnhA subunit
MSSYTSPVSLSLSWVPSLNIGLSFRLDTVSLFFIGLILSFGTAVFAYALHYIKERKATFFTILGIFLVAMLGTVASNNILLLFIFWELTSIMSFLLIGFNNHTQEGQFGARISLMVTGLGALVMLVGLLMLGVAFDTFLLSEILTKGSAILYENPTLSAATIACIFVGIASKSAQFPFHFWLPRAMAAPTPVSAFLHSAAMVKLGIFLVITFMPLFASFNVWTYTLIGFGTVTMLLGIIAGFSSHSIKTILAYTTVSKLGFLVMMYGISYLSNTYYGFFHILNHALYKAALFMFAGILIKLAKEKDIRKMVLPQSKILAVGLTFSTLGFAAIPLTSGFVSKEIALKDLLYLIHSHPFTGFVLGAVVITSILSVCIAWRFLRLAKQLYTSTEAPSTTFSLSPVVLSFFTILLGVYPQVIVPFFELLFSSYDVMPSFYLLVPFHGFNLAFAISVMGILAGSLLALQQAKLNTLQWPARLQFEHGTHTILDQIIAKGDLVFRWLQFNNPFAFIPITLTVCVLFFAWGITVADISLFDAFNYATISSSLVKNAILLMTALLVVSLLFVKFFVTKIVIVSLVGLFVSLIFVMWRAPDLAITQLLVDIMALLLLLFIVRVLKQDRDDRTCVPTVLSWPKLIISSAVGIMFFFIQVLLEGYRHEKPFGLDINSLTLPFAEGQNAVNTILVDFRGFDTFGEVTVLVISVMGIFSIFMKRKSA